MKSLSTTVVVLCLAASASAFLRFGHDDATVVERSELIVVGHLESGSIHYVPHEAKASEGKSWEHHATLVIVGVLKGMCPTNKIPIIIHYGLTPVVGGYVKQESFMVDRRSGRGDYPTNKVEIFDTGNSIQSFRPLVEDAAEDNLWFLRRRSGTYGQEAGTGNLGIVDPEDLQPLKLRAYFLCYLSDRPEEALRKYSADHPDVLNRVAKYFDHLALQTIVREPDLARRSDRLLPYYLKGQTWNGQPEAKAALLACGMVAGEKLLSVFDDPKYESRRPEIILMWRDVNYVDAAPRLIKLLEADDRFWAAQTLSGDWWNADPGTDRTRERQAKYAEVCYAVSVLGGFKDPHATEVIELTRQRWQSIERTQNPMVLEACEAALKALTKQ